jgi:hypothetical protein
VCRSPADLHRLSERTQSSVHRCGIGKQLLHITVKDDDVAFLARRQSRADRSNTHAAIDARHDHWAPRAGQTEQDISRFTFRAQRI